MKKVAALTLLFIILLFGGTAYADNIDSSTLNNYNISVELNPSSQTLTGRERIIYYNAEDVPLNEIYFHIYPNAFKSINTVPYLKDDFNNAYPNGFKPGYLDILSLSCKNRTAAFKVEGRDNTILKVNLDKPLYPGEKLDITMNFKEVIPPSADRFGYYNYCYNFGNWYPVAAVYDKDGWNLNPYYSIGDPFYSDVSNYSVTITVPKGYTPAASGDMASLKCVNNKNIYVFGANYMRDFAWSVSNKFAMSQKVVDGVTIKSYYLKGHEGRNSVALSSAEQSLRIFNNLFGKYPYKTYSVVDTNMIGGMEYPGIVFISRDLYNNDVSKDELDVVVAHETAHQWWYGVVGDDEIDEAWLDESFATYCEALYYEKRYGETSGKAYYKTDILGSYNGTKDILQGQETIEKPLSSFISWDDYVPMVYYKGAVMLDSIRGDIGDNLFFETLKTYFNTYKFKNATSKDFIGTLSSVTKKDWSEFFSKWLYGK